MTDDTLPTSSDGLDSNGVEGDGAPLRRRPNRPRKRGTRYFIRDLVIIVVVAILASFLIKTFLIQSYFIPSASMENTLRINDRIIVDELVPHVIPLQRGDVVVFKDPGGWLPETVPPAPQSPLTSAVDGFLSFVGFASPGDDDHLVKRVIGLPGDHVVCCNALGQIEVNGSPLKEPYIVVPPGRTAAATLSFNVTVPAGELWVMGDNRYNSQDSSRNQDLPGKGFVPISDVVGRAILISWPVSHWTWLSNYPQTFAGAAAQAPGASAPHTSAARAEANLASGEIDSAQIGALSAGGSARGR
jgi:signal peptidase I